MIFGVKLYKTTVDFVKHVLNLVTALTNAFLAKKKYVLIKEDGTYGKNPTIYQYALLVCFFEHPHFLQIFFFCIKNIFHITLSYTISTSKSRNGFIIESSSISGYVEEIISGHCLQSIMPCFFNRSLASFNSPITFESYMV